MQLILTKNRSKQILETKTKEPKRQKVIQKDSKQEPYAAQQQKIA